MALNDILEKINKETELKIAQIEKEFNEKIVLLKEEFKKKQKNIDEDIHKRIKEKSSSILEKAKNLAHRESQNHLLESKRELIEKCINESIKELSESKNYEEIITKLLEKSDMKDGSEVIPAKGKEDITKQALKKSGKSFKISENSANIQGGFIIRSTKIEIDNSFETIIKKQLRDDIEINLNNILFS